MSIRTFLATAAAFAMIAGVSPALAKNDKTPPGDPCSKGNGNPCNGNNGNLGHQGNSGHERVKKATPGPINIALPPVSGRGAFITQIGDDNLATVRQTAPNAYAKVDQQGDANEADIAQKGSGTGYVEASQNGDANFAAIAQDGAGQNVLYASQKGNGNWLSSSQSAAGMLHNGAIMTQLGDNNDMALTQNGADNRAVLTQDGNGNGMTAVQNNDGNRLIWTQQGNGLSDLQITQNGGAVPGGQLQVTQTGSGR